jgi:5-methyltetrahydropteroyltriglutamate--homocysteine methyltransferase
MPVDYDGLAMANIETVDDVLRLVEQANRRVSVDELALSPTCGFASSTADGQPSHDHQWRKLDVLVEAAARIC